MMKTFRLVIVIIFLLMIVLLPTNKTTAQSEYFTIPLADTVLCGNGSESEDYGLSYDLLQPHWTVGWEGYVSEDTVNQVDVILDDLTEANIAETMILFLPA